MKEILYSLYYWGHRFIERSNAISLSDAGFEQWHFSLIEKIESSCGAVDFTLLEKIDKNEALECAKEHPFKGAAQKV